MGQKVINEAEALSELLELTKENNEILKQLRDYALDTDRQDKKMAISFFLNIMANYITDELLGFGTTNNINTSDNGNNVQD